VTFLILLNMKLDHGHLESLHLSYVVVFSPLWVFLAISLVLAVVSCCVVCCICIGFCNKKSSSEQQQQEYIEDDRSSVSSDSSYYEDPTQQRRNKYLSAAFPLLLFDAIVFPFILLLELKLESIESDQHLVPPPTTQTNSSIAWTSVFIPLWVTDGLLLLVSLVLLLFTVGGRQDATFSLFSVGSFVVILLSSVAFKVLLVLLLQNQAHLSFFVVVAPLVLAFTLFICCGIHLKLRHKPQQQQQLLRVD